MIKECKGWKVLSKDRNSCTTNTWNQPDFKIHYPVGVEVSPKVKGSKLFFFKNREDADNFRVYGGNTDIVVPCIAKNVTKATYGCCSTVSVHSFWKLKLSHKKVSDISNYLPQGSYWADSITCLL